jgi:hypothetical protein
MAKALNNTPVGLSEIRFIPSLTLSCATGIIEKICNTTIAKFKKLKVIAIKLIFFKLILLIKITKAEISINKIVGLLIAFMSV